MTDDKKPRAGFEDLDWDQALAEWESKTFVPEVARDIVADRPAALPTATAVSKPLYRPPSIPPPARSPPSVAPPSARPLPVDPLAFARTFARDDEDEEATLIAAIPPELLRTEDGASRSTSRGGLSQIFSRDSLDSGPAKPSPSVLRAETVNLDALFDPPSAARAHQLTLPAEDEVASTAWPDARAPRESSGVGPKASVPASSRPTPDERPAGRSPPPLAGSVAASSGTQAIAELLNRSDSARGGATIPGDEEVARSSLPPGLTRTWHDEKPAPAWLDEAARSTLEERARWLEEEARAVSDIVERGRALLTCSEILASVGDRDHAQALAAEARELAPSLALAHRQARVLMAWPPDPEDYVEGLEIEVNATAAGPARVHSALLAADALRARGDDDEADRRIAQALDSDGTDVRAAVARVVRALGQGDTSRAALRLPPSDALAPIAAAVATCLRLRDVEAETVTEGAPPAPSASEIVLRARRALDGGRVGKASLIVAELADTPELSRGAWWLAAALAAPNEAERPDAAVWLERLVASGEPGAGRVLLARAIELRDRDRIAELIADTGVFTAAEVVTVAALAGLPLVASDTLLDGAAAIDGMAPLVCAIAAIGTPPDQERAARTAGSAHSRAQVTLGRLLASRAEAPLLEAALRAMAQPERSVARGIAIELASRLGRFGEVSLAVEALGQSADRTEAALAAALIAERAHDMPRAVAAFKAARDAEPTSEAPLRALASIEPVDLVSEMNAIADESANVRAAFARLEAVTRGESMLAEPTQAHLLERAHRAAPTLPIALFLVERIARRSGDVDEVLRWIRERRAATSDRVEAALDSVREALLVADREPELASERLREAHLVRPRDVALRDLYERMATDPPTDRASWREQRAAEAAGDARVLLSLEAAHEYERIGDDEGAFRCAIGAALTETSLGRIARERAELGTGRVSRLADELLTEAKGADDGRAQREAYERLAVLDATARKDGASALLWHRSILEHTPAWKPSLRYVEHELIGEGREDDLEPVASAIATSLRGSGPGEATAHAELAVRLRMRAGPGRWESAREMMDLAASVSEPSLSTLRLLQSRARAAADDRAFLAVTKRLVDRSSRAAESAALLLRAGEAALRLDEVDEARALLEEAAVQDPGDVVTWWRLAEVKRRGGDPQGAAEAYESVARTSGVRVHQLAALYDAGQLWQDEAHDDERATSAFEAAAALDVTYEDVFGRLSRLYAARKLPAELAELLERRIERISDPEERLAIEVQRGRLLLEVGDMAGARRAFEGALSRRPDDPSALSSFADLCTAQSDWEAAEQALVRLTRLLPTPEEQRGVYARLGDLYSHHLLNLARAEIALKEVRKRAPEDQEPLEKLVEIHKRQNDPARAVEVQEELVARAASADEKRKRILDLAAIHERAARDPRRAEKTLEAARREAPQDVVLLRALAEFYARHHQTPAVNILLDRAAGDARRALAGGVFHPGPFEIIATAFDLRGKGDAARTTKVFEAAVQGRAATLRGAGDAAFDPQLDDALAPDPLTPALRSLLTRTGAALDAAFPVDVRELRATPLSAEAPIVRLALRTASAIGLRGLQVFSSPRLRGGCIPMASEPPAIIVGEELDDAERAGAFLVLRALKLVLAKASVLGRVPPADLSALLCAWLKCINPTWQPKGVLPAALAAAEARVAKAMPSSFEPDVGVLALEAAGTLDVGHATLGARAIEWVNRVALLALGDPNAALDAIARAGGDAAGAPQELRERAHWIAVTPQARDLVTFGVSDAFAQARSRLRIDG